MLRTSFDRSLCFPVGLHRYFVVIVATASPVDPSMEGQTTRLSFVSRAAQPREWRVSSRHRRSLTIVVMADSLRGLCVEATQAFLRKDYAKSLIYIQKGISCARDEKKPQTWLDQLLVLRFTVIYTVYINAQVQKRVMNLLHQCAEEDSCAQEVIHLLRLSPQALYTSLWYECLYAMAQQTCPTPVPPNLELPEGMESVLLSMPSSVLSSAILMALRIDAYSDQDGSMSAPSSCARQICEMYFTASLHASMPLPDHHSYEQILRLYVIQVLGIHHADWEYAQNFVAYSTLSDDKKQTLLHDLEAEKNRYLSRMQHEQDILRQIQQEYDNEVARKANISNPPDTQTDSHEPKLVSSLKPTKPRTTLQRTPSVRSRPAPDPTTSSPPKPDVSDISSIPASSHADELEHLQNYVARRPMDEPPISLPPRSLSILSVLSSSLTRQRVLTFFLVILSMLAYRGLTSPSIKRNRGISWVMLFWLRVRDTLRMYVLLRLFKKN